MKISPICWVCLRKRIPYQEIKLSKATQGLPALEARLNFLARRLYSRSWKMVGWLFWGDNQTKEQRTSFRESGLLPHLPPEGWREGTGGSCRPSSSAPCSSPCLGPACASGFPGGLQGGCSGGAQQFALLCLQPTGKCRDLAVLVHDCWALLSQFTENQSCKKILPGGSKSLQLLFFF